LKIESLLSIGTCRNELLIGITMGIDDDRLDQTDNPILQSEVLIHENRSSNGVGWRLKSTKMLVWIIVNKAIPEMKYCETKSGCH
jgi:hypothetical protein